MKDNVLRGKLIEFLRKVYPDGVEQASIISIFFQYHKADDIATSLEYLVDKGYALRKEYPHPYIQQEIIHWYKLAPSGMDLYEGNIDPDPGILIPRHSSGSEK